MKIFIGKGGLETKSTYKFFFCVKFVISIFAYSQRSGVGGGGKSMIIHFFINVNLTKIFAAIKIPP